MAISESTHYSSFDAAIELKNKNLLSKFRESLFNRIILKQLNAMGYDFATKNF